MNQYLLCECNEIYLKFRTCRVTQVLHMLEGEFTAVAGGNEELQEPGLIRPEPYGDAGY